jgi:ABC-type Fe3+-hydroxamate transport system substrate-binding protein
MTAAWVRENLASTVVLAAVLLVAFTLHLAGGDTATPEAVRRPGDDGKPDFRMTSAYPRQAADGQGFTLTIARPARRIASHSWAVDEFVYSVVPPERVVSVSDSAYDRVYSNVYEWAEKFQPVVGSNPEVVLKQEPDLLIASSSGRADFTDILRDAGVPVFRMFTMFTTLDQVAKSIRLTGYLTGEDGGGHRAYDEFQNIVARAQGRIMPGAPVPRVLGYRMRGDGARFTYGDKTLFHDIVRTAGAVNIGAENGVRTYELISAEQIIRWDPEWIVSGADPGKSGELLAAFMLDPAFALTTAARKRQILIVEHNVFLPMSPFTALLLDALSQALYPKTGT